MKALTVGSAMIDTIAIIPSDRVERMTMLNADKAFLLMEEGKKTEAEAISTHLGGGGVNTAVSLARLGFDTSTLVKVGDDQRAENILAGFKREGISPQWVLRDPHLPTGASVIISSHERNAGIFTYRGANTALEACDIDAAAFAADLVHICSLSHPSTACFPRIVAEAKKAGAQVSANPGQRQLTARAAELIAALGDIDILFMNRTEAEAFMPALVPQFGDGCAAFPIDDSEAPDLLVHGLEGGGFTMTVRHFMTSMLALGLKTMVITDGGHGAFIARDGQLTHCPIVQATIAGTAGAGDAFSSTFSAWRALGQSIEAAATAASCNAAGVVAHVDTQEGLMTRPALEAALQTAKLGGAVRVWPL